MKNLKAKIELCRKYGNINPSYDYKMGGVTNITITKSGETIHVEQYDEREYYQGRGSKYNSSIKHDLKEVTLSCNELTKRWREAKAYFKNREEAIKERELIQESKSLRVKDAKNKGVYTFEGFTNSDEGAYLELSDSEIHNREFDAKRLSETLNIQIEDVELLKSNGKTYVFATSFCGETYRLYHPNLEVNNLSIHVQKVDSKEVEKFDHKEWSSAPYAKELGQTENQNHFVC